MLYSIYSYLETSKIKYLVFGVLLFVFSASHASYLYSSTLEVFITYSIRVGFQIGVSFVIIEFLIPQFLNTGKKKLFTTSSILLLLFCYVMCTAISMYYLEVNFPNTYVNYLKRFSNTSWLGRLTNFSEIISKSLYLLYPTFLLLVFTLYNEKQRLLKLNEQKKIAELSALKNQLNPHFLFNTLNNLYALALKKSDDTTLVIEKLSNILDYILYRCDDDFVLLENEIKLIENYVSLEKIRYGNRVHISFEKNVTGKEKIAPLLLLTFVENAFKHGVKEEINQATINISITKKNDKIVFNIKNTKYKQVVKSASKKSIGLINIKKQLDLLYPKAYDLIIDNTQQKFSANLILNVI